MSEEYVFTQRLGCGQSKKEWESFTMMKTQICLILKKICEGDRRSGLVKLLYLVAVVL